MAFNLGDSDTRIVLAFDVYGTLLSTQSIADELASHVGEGKASTIATAWRKYQLEYTWRLNSMGQYEDFAKLTRRSLKHALAESAVSLDEQAMEEIMEAYASLSCFPDVAKTMEDLAQSASDIRAVAFSNGTLQMVSSSIENSPDLGKQSVLGEIVVVEAVRRYKPAPEVYLYLATRLGKDVTDQKQMKGIWLISGNPFDVVGAKALGMNAIWVDRAGAGWQDSLIEGPDGVPSAVVKSLDQVVPTVKSNLYGS